MEEGMTGGNQGDWSRRSREREWTTGERNSDIGNIDESGSDFGDRREGNLTNGGNRQQQSENYRRDDNIEL
jgi:hypothetical protein